MDSKTREGTPAEGCWNTASTVAAGRLAIARPSSPEEAVLAGASPASSPGKVARNANG